MREEREALRLPVHYPLTISHYPYSWREWCRGTESNCRHQPFQGCALPTELPRHLVERKTWRIDAQQATCRWIQNGLHDTAQVLARSSPGTYNNRHKIRRKHPG